MVFGPESDNPRARRAYAHMMVSKLARGEVNYGEALQAAYRASRSARGRASGFEGALSNAADKVTQKQQGTSPGRSIRRVPLNWQHPKDEGGQFIPLYDTREPVGEGKYTIEDLEWMINEDGNISLDEDIKASFMPTFNNVPLEEVDVCLYERVSEGTPITPVFPDTEQGHKDLAAYAARHATSFAHQHESAEVWQQRFFGQSQDV